MSWKIFSLIVIIVGIIHILMPYKVLTLWGHENWNCYAWRTENMKPWVIKLMVQLIRVGGILTVTAGLIFFFEL